MTSRLPSTRLTVFETVRFLWHLPTLVRLLARLIGDRGVATVGKILFFAGILFIVSPFDIPNDIPVLGQMSDLMLALLACRWFINSCPAELVAGHLAAIRGRARVPALP